MLLLAFGFITLLHLATPVVKLSDVAGWSWNVGPKGPLTWGIKWPLCVEKGQSPIHIPFLTVNTCIEPVGWYNLEQPQPYSILQNGYRSAIWFPDPAYPVYAAGGGLPAGHSYHVIGAFFHVGHNDSLGSQHEYYSRYYPMEIVVILSSDPYVNEDNWLQSNALAAVSFFVSVAPNYNALWNPIISGLSRIQTGGSKTIVNLPSLLDLLPHYQKWHTEYASYTGSLPHPPCTQGVVWIVYPTTIPLSSAQIAQFRTLKDETSKPILDNFRPIQGLGHQRVLLIPQKASRSSSPVYASVQG